MKLLIEKLKYVKFINILHRIESVIGVGVGVPLGEPCQAGEFQCKSDQVCIAIALRCDGQSDCSDASDESGCRTYRPSTSTSICQPLPPRVLQLLQSIPPFHLFFYCLKTIDFVMLYLCLISNITYFFHY